MAIEKKKVLTLEEVKERGLKYFDYWNGVYEYKTEDGLWHLIIDGKNVLENIEAVDCWYYADGVYGYKTTDGLKHLIINGVDVLKDKEAVWCRYFFSGVYCYVTKDGEWLAEISGFN